jgi:hypothetical protein
MSNLTPGLAAASHSPKRVPRGTAVILTLALCGLAAGVRLAALQTSLPPARLGTENERVAAALAAGQGWSDTFDIGTGPSAHTAPLYPLLLAGVYRLCGDYTTQRGQNVQRGLSIALSILALLLLPVVARKLGLSAAAGWIAAFVGAGFPSNLRVELTGRHESVPATLALLGLIWCFADLRQRGWTGRLALARTGCLLGITALLCPNFLLLPVLFLLVELGLGSGQRRRIFCCGLVLAGISLLLVAPWLVRNYRVLGGFVPLRSNFGLELAVGNRPGADGHTYTEGMAEMHPYNSAAERARLVQLGELPYMRDKQRQALEWIKDNPRSFAGLMLRRARLFWITTSETWLLFLPLYTTLALAAALELLRLLRTNPPAGRLLACTLLAAGLPYVLTHVELRYRLPISGLYLLLAVHLAVVIVSWLFARRPQHARFDIGPTVAWSGRMRYGAKAPVPLRKGASSSL